MKVIAITAFLFALITSVEGQQNPLFKKEIFISNADTLPYRLSYPPDYISKKKYPLVLFLHGAGERGNDNDAQLKHVSLFIDSANQTKYPCFILVPQCPKNDVWVSFPNFPHSLLAADTPTIAARLTLELINRLEKNLPIDKNRIYVTGLSMGGEGTIDFLARDPSLFAAAIPLCGVADTSKAKSIKSIPIWVFHGKEDAINNVEYSRMMVAALKKAGGNPKYTEYKEEKHDCWTKAYSESALLPWLFSQTRK
jgi:predicted peptidase